MSIRIAPEPKRTKITGKPLQEFVSCIALSDVINVTVTAINVLSRLFPRTPGGYKHRQAKRFIRKFFKTADDIDALPVDQLITHLCNNPDGAADIQRTYEEVRALVYLLEDNSRMTGEERREEVLELVNHGARGVGPAITSFLIDMVLAEI